MGYIGQKLWNILWDIWVLIVGYILQNYGIYWSIRYIKIKLTIYNAKLWDIFRKNYGIYLQKQWDIFQRTMGYIGENHGIYWAKTIGYFMGYI